MEADVTLVSGALTGAGVYVDWDGGGAQLSFSTDVDTSGAVIGAGTTGKLYKFRKLVQLTAGTTYNGLYAMSHWAGHGSIAGANTLTWHRCALRAASQAEIEARAATTALVTTNANVATNNSAIATESSARAAADTTLYASLGSGVNILDYSDWSGVFPAAGGSISAPPGVDYYVENDPNTRLSYGAIGTSALSSQLVPGFGGVYFEQAVDATYDGSHYGGFAIVRAPAQSGKNYIASAYVGSNPALASMYLLFLDSAGASLGTGTANISTFPTSGGGGTKIGDWNRWQYSAVAPANTASVVLILYRIGSSSGSTTYVSMMGFMIEEARTGQTTASPWAPGRKDANYASIVTNTAAIITNAAAIATETSARASADTTLTASVGTLTSSVATNASAITSVDGKLSASYALTVDGNGRIAQMKLLSNGTTSSVKFKADTFAIYNNVSDVAVFNLTGSQLKLNADLNVSSGITVGSARLKVALESILKTGADGASITWADGVSIGSAPAYVLDLSTLAPLTTGEAYSVSLTGVTATGATVYAKIITPGTTSTVTQTTDAAGGGGDPTRVMAKSDSADAYNGTYSFRVVGDMTITGTYDGSLGQWVNSGNLVVSTWFNDGGGWDQGPNIDFFSFYTGATDDSGTVSVDDTFAVAWANAIGAGSTYDFGVSAISGGTVTDLHTVSYLKQTSSGLRTASPAGETVKITAFPRNA